MDLSYLDKKYFIDPHIFNCPFCRRNNVSYKIHDHFTFDWDNNKKCYCYLIQCQSIGCDKISLHWSWKEIRQFLITNKMDKSGYYANQFSNKIDIDNYLFFSQPSSFFTIDNRIDSKIRDLIWEAEQSRRANLLVGASACLRKAIYELLKKENSIIINQKTKKADYKESIKTLKSKFTYVSGDLFDVILNVQELASDNLHEESWEAWDSKKLRFLIELVRTTLEEMYVIPDERKKRLSSLTQLKQTYESDKKDKSTVV